MRWAVTFLLSGVSAPCAIAGPWGQQDGDVFARAAYSNEQIDGADAWRADIYGEYGVSENWTLIGKAEAVQFPGADDFNASEARLVAQRKLFKGQSFVIAAGGGAVYGAAIGGAIGCDTVGAEARTSIGSGGLVAGRGWYASVDLSGRWHSGGCHRRKLDLVTGIDVGKNTVFSPQIYVEQSNRGADSMAVQVEWIYKNPQFDLTLGYKYENGDLFDQQATIIAISKRF